VTTVASRRFTSTPQRDAAATWRAIVELLTKGQLCAARDEFLVVAGIASSIIADKAPKDAAIVVTCDGPRTRIYCLYDDEAVYGCEANEDPLGFDPLMGDWRVSLPCNGDDLAWVQGALKKHSSRISARDQTAAVSTGDDTTDAKSSSLVLDPKGFFGS
jgi:hypothetical protein